MVPNVKIDLVSADKSPDQTSYKMLAANLVLRLPQNA